MSVGGKGLGRSFLRLHLRLPALALLAAAWAPTPGAWAAEQAASQAGTPNPAPAANPDESNNDAGSSAASGESQAPVPLPLSLDAGLLEFSQEMAHSNYFNLGVEVGANYDDNLLSVTAPQLGGFSYSVTPDLGLHLTRPRLLLNLNYGGGYIFNQRFSAYNQTSQGAGIDLLYRMSPHVNLRLADHFSLTTGFLDQQAASPGETGAGFLEQPNQTLVTPFARRTDDVGTVQLTYQYSAGDMVGMSGTYDQSWFGAPPAGAAVLLDSRNLEADGFYTHRFTPRNWSGVAYMFQRLTFTPASESVDTHSLFLFHTIHLQRRMQLGFFAGPEYSELTLAANSTTVPTTPPLPEQDRWSGAGGASFSWQGERTSISAGGLRKISDGGGLLTAVDVTSGNASIRRQLARSASIELSGLYGDSKALGQGVGASAFNEIKSAAGSFVWVQQMGRSFTATLGYARQYQRQSVPNATPMDVNHNRAWVTLGYHLSRPLGN